MHAEPIFVHSMFRSGSTYLFSVFRRSESNYWCYQEPLHEYIRHVSDAPHRLLEVHHTLGSALRHPDLEKPYFWEYYEVKDAIAPLFTKQMSYDWFFIGEGREEFDKVGTYLRCLVEEAKGTPFLQCCRSFGRVTGLRNTFVGKHIHLWRNPWDQWWSYQVDGYFDATSHLILNALEPPTVLTVVKILCGIPDFHDPDIEKEITFNWK